MLCNVSKREKERSNIYDAREFLDKYEIQISNKINCLSFL